MAMRYQSNAKKSNRKFAVVGARQLAVHLPLPLVELWEELQPQVEHLAGLAGLQIIRGVIEEEVTRREYQILDRAFDHMVLRSRTENISHRTAAMAIGVEKVRGAKNTRGLFP